MFIIYNIYNIWYLYRICLYNVFFTSIISIISKQDCGDAVEPTSAGLHRGDAGENPWFYSRWSSGLAADSRSKSLWNIIFTSFSRHFHRSLADSVPCCAKVRSLGQIFGARSFDVSWLLAHNFSYCSWGWLHMTSKIFQAPFRSEMVRVSMWNVSQGFSLGPLCYYGCYGCSLRQNSSRCGKSFAAWRGDAPGHSGKRGRNRCRDPNGSQDPGRVTFWIDVNRCECVSGRIWKILWRYFGNESHTATLTKDCVRIRQS